MIDNERHTTLRHHCCTAVEFLRIPFSNDNLLQPPMGPKVSPMGLHVFTTELRLNLDQCPFTYNLMPGGCPSSCKITMRTVSRSAFEPRASGSAFAVHHNGK